MKKYEVMFIVKPVEEVADKMCDYVASLIRENGGDIVKVDKWGKKRLVYEIRDNCEGIYFLITFNANDATIGKADRKMKQTEDIMRHMFVSHC